MGGKSSRQNHRPNSKLLTQSTVDTIGDYIAKWNGLRIRLHQVEVREIKKLMEETAEVMHRHNILEVGYTILSTSICRSQIRRLKCRPSLFCGRDLLRVWLADTRVFCRCYKYI